MKVLLTCFAEPHCAVGHATKQQPTWRISVATMHTMLLAVNEISLQWQRRSGRGVQKEREKETRQISIVLTTKLAAEQRSRKNPWHKLLNVATSMATTSDNL